MNSSCHEIYYGVSTFSGLKVRKGISYVLINFAAPIVFYLAFHRLGPKPAIALAIGATGIQLGVHWVYRLSISPFFMVASGFTVSFGLIDLFIQSPRFFRLEPFAQNFLIATVLLFTYFARIPILAYFIRALPEALRPRVFNSTSRYLRKLTLIWAIYLYLKSILFLYLAFRVDLGALIVLRSVIGGGTLVLMFVGEMLYRKCFGQSLDI